MEDILPTALMMGVNYDLFWTLNPKSLTPFIKAFILKQKYDDTLAWKQGAYIKMAIASSFGKNSKYPQKPLLEDSKLVPKTIEEKRKEMKDKMMGRMNLINKKFGKGEDNA